MPRPGRTQKQIAERYKGNLGYYNKPHPWRRARLFVSLAAILAAILAIWWVSQHSSESFFSAGPITSNHSSIAGDCAKCHDRSFISGGNLTPSIFVAELK